MQNSNIPLAERVRPKKLSDIIGQDHLIGASGLLNNALKLHKLPSIIFWGPPGVGKTTLAQLIAKQIDKPFFSLSAIQAGVKEVRQVIDQAKKMGGAILFIDEIHRFNKGQQDALLGAVEKGIITLIGATTENPSFEINRALLSRCQVYILNELGINELKQIALLALEQDTQFKDGKYEITEFDALLRYSGGDARKLLNLLEMAIYGLNPILTKIGNKEVEQVAQQKMSSYDKTGENHYDIISAFIKSMRGSDPNAAVYWLARMLKGGEDIKFIARRMLVLASEDIGNANPTALVIANNCFQAVQVIGMPEARIILSQAVIYLASSPKSNASYLAINKALEEVEKSGDLSVPLHLRNAPTQLMKNLNYGGQYDYVHDFQGNFVKQDYLPQGVSDSDFFKGQNNPREEQIAKVLKELWQDKYSF